MIRKSSSHQSVSSMFVFVLLLIFALFALSLAGFGSVVYRKGTDNFKSNYSSRTAQSYLTEKIRQHNAAGSISLSDVEGTPALVLSEQISGEDFLTYIYYYQDALREIMVRKETVPALLMGDPVVELSSFDVSLDGSVLKLTVSDRSSSGSNTFTFYQHLADEQTGGAYGS